MKFFLEYPLLSDADDGAWIDPAIMAELGRDPDALDVASGSFTPLPRDASLDQRLEELDRLAGLGITWTGAPIPRSSFAAALNGLREFGETVVAAHR